MRTALAYREMHIFTQAIPGVLCVTSNIARPPSSPKRKDLKEVWTCDYPSAAEARPASVPSRPVTEAQGESWGEGFITETTMRTRRTTKRRSTRCSSWQNLHQDLTPLLRVGELENWRPIRGGGRETTHYGELRVLPLAGMPRNSPGRWPSGAWLPWGYGTINEVGKKTIWPNDLTMEDTASSHSPIYIYTSFVRLSTYLWRLASVLLTHIFISLAHALTNETRNGDETK